MHSITSTMILLFLFAPSSTKVKTFDHFHFTLMLVGVIRIIELLVGVNGMFIRFKKLENGLPWLTMTNHLTLNEIQLILLYICNCSFTSMIFMHI